MKLSEVRPFLGGSKGTNFSRFHRLADGIPFQLDTPPPTPSIRIGSNGSVPNNILYNGSMVKNLQARLEDKLEELFEKMILKRLKSVDERMERILGVPRPVEEKEDDGYIESPFAESVYVVEIPKRFSIPNMSMYDGTSDPDMLVSLYKQKMMTNLMRD